MRRRRAGSEGREGCCQGDEGDQSCELSPGGCEVHELSVRGTGEGRENAFVGAGAKVCADADLPGEDGLEIEHSAHERRCRGNADDHPDDRDDVLLAPST